MERSFWVGLLCSLVVPVHAESAVSVDAYGFVAFNQLDSDRNGYISRVEARSVSGVERAFESADANRDGLLDRKEYSRAESAAEVR